MKGSSMTRASRLLIEHRCPQCGAPVELEETDHLFSCPFCRVRSFLHTRDFFRFMLPHAAPRGESLVYVPYWRLKGILFSSLSERIDHRIVDLSHQALPCKHLPLSLGLRTQALRLRFVSPETEGYFLKPALPLKDMLQSVEKRFGSNLSQPVFCRSFIGETTSQIYSPFYGNGSILDAVLNRPVPSDFPPDFELKALPGGPPDWQIQFVPALCPSCGWDLEGERDAVALHCRNCTSLWIHQEKGFRKLPFGFMPSEAEPVLYLPFYRIRPEIKGLDLASYADLVRVANLPKVLQEGMDSKPFHFWSPAFKVRPRDFLQFSRVFTLSQPEQTWEPRIPKAETHPVTLPIAEALESLKINLAGFVKPPGLMLPALVDIRIAAKSVFLVYVPFQVRRDEILYPPFQLRTTKNMLHYARHL